VTDRVAIERAKAEFLAMTSHELRTLLTAIHAAVGLVISGLLGEIPVKAQENLAIAQANSDRLLALVENIVGLEQLTLGHITLAWSQCDSLELLREAADQVAGQADQAKVFIDVRGDSIGFECDHGRLVQTLTILVGNAIQFSPASSTVRLKSRAENNAIVFEVADDGVGIPANAVDQVFETFQQVDGSDTRRSGGSGLGLAIAKRIVEQHHGRIWAESVEGQGSVFRFSVPLEQQGPPQPLA
jgi:signal transduction histidine kinase